MSSRTPYSAFVVKIIARKAYQRGRSSSANWMRHYGPGVKFVGATTDPIGRKGVAVAMDDTERPTPRRLIFAPRTGAMLGEEDRLLEGNWMHPPAGTRIGWAAYLRQEVVDRIK